MSASHTGQTASKKERIESLQLKSVERFLNPHGAFDSPTRHLAYWRNFANLE